jgi:hypothetical protein
MRFGLKEKVCLRLFPNSVVLTVIQILALNADNATSNDTQTAALSLIENLFEEVNHTWCFNHTLQLSAKVLRSGDLNVRLARVSERRVL